MAISDNQHRLILESLSEDSLVNEIAGMNEIGVRNPRGRLPGKTNLPKVLLTSNPLMEKDLERKLKYINNNQTKREKTLEWNQKHFLVSRIFDSDYNLRFTKGPKSYINGGPTKRFYSGGKQREQTQDEPNSLDSPEPSRCSSAAFPETYHKDGARRRSSGLGIFMPPLHPSQRLIEKQKIPKNSMASTNVFNLNGNANTRSDETRRQTRPMTEQSARHLPLIRRSASLQMVNQDRPPPQTADPTQNRRKTVHFLPGSDVTSTQTAHFRPVRSASTLEKSISLPDFTLYEPIIEASEPDNIDEDDMLKTENVRSARQYSKKPELEVLCEDELVTKLTRSLPISLMIKANQNINREVQKRKNVMIAKCRKSRDRKTLEDPRWQRLETVLSSGSNESILKSQSPRFSLLDM